MLKSFSLQRLLKLCTYKLYVRLHKEQRMLEKYSIKTSFSQSLVQKKFPGFLLIEIMASLVMLAASISLISYFCSHIIALQHDARRYNEAISLASDLFERIQEDGTIAVLNKENKIFSMQYVIREVAPKNTSSLYAQTFKNLREIELRIAWKTFTGKKQTYTVSTCCELTS